MVTVQVAHACLDCFPYGILVIFIPIPPTPFPPGRGRIIIYFCKGLPPLASLCCLPTETDSGNVTLRPEFTVVCFLASAQFCKAR